MNLHTIACEEFLKKMAIPGYKHTYALGLFAKRVTIRSQQLRALNLIHALVAGNHIARNGRVLVIGAGFGGITAAAAASRAECSVLVLERAQSRLSLQRNCRHRFLHPHLYDWPRPGSLNPDAGLPVLKLEANIAESVVKEIDRQLNEPLTNGRIREAFGIKRVTVQQTGKVTWSEPTANRTESFDAVILAVGFGTELRGRAARVTGLTFRSTLAPRQERRC
jgi:threonine dehydrogenase-like Zn-dependent dehydrogenase